MSVLDGPAIEADLAETGVDIALARRGPVALADPADGSDAQDAKGLALRRDDQAGRGWAFVVRLRDDERAHGQGALSGGGPLPRVH